MSEVWMDGQTFKADRMVDGIVKKRRAKVKTRGEAVDPNVGE
jgi:hypothetical protein